MPVGFTPTFEQCPAASACIDHPTSIDLSRLSSVLDPVLHITPAELATTMLPGHDHLLTTRNGNNPEWWDVIVIPVTSQAALHRIQVAKRYAAVTAMETGNFRGALTGPRLNRPIAGIATDPATGGAPSTAAALADEVQRSSLRRRASGSRDDDGASTWCGSPARAVRRARCHAGVGHDVDLAGRPGRSAPRMTAGCRTLSRSRR